MLERVVDVICDNQRSDQLFCAMSAREIRSLIDMFGPVAEALQSATHDEHHRTSTACRLCEYDPPNRTVRASIIDPTDGACGFERVRGGT
jgi:hypothetical protein